MCGLDQVQQSRSSANGMFSAKKCSLNADTKTSQLFTLRYLLVYSAVLLSPSPISEYITPSKYDVWCPGGDLPRGQPQLGVRLPLVRSGEASDCTGASVSLFVVRDITCHPKFLSFILPYLQFRYPFCPLSCKCWLSMLAMFRVTSPASSCPLSCRKRPRNSFPSRRQRNCSRSWTRYLRSTLQRVL